MRRRSSARTADRSRRIAPRFPRPRSATPEPGLLPRSLRTARDPSSPRPPRRRQPRHRGSPARTHPRRRSTPALRSAAGVPGNALGVAGPGSRPEPHNRAGTARRPRPPASRSRRQPPPWREAGNRCLSSAPGGTPSEHRTDRRQSRTASEPLHAAPARLRTCSRPLRRGAPHAAREGSRSRPATPPCNRCSRRYGRWPPPRRASGLAASASAAGPATPDRGGAGTNGKRDPRTTARSPPRCRRETGTRSRGAAHRSPPSGTPPAARRARPPARNRS